MFRGKSATYQISMLIYKKMAIHPAQCGLVNCMDGGSSWEKCPAL